MQWLDWVILASYLSVLTAIGLYFARRQETLSQFVKGEKNFGWLTIGLSLMAALDSGIDYIQTPAVVYTFGMVYVSLVLTWIPLYFWATRVTLPFYRKLNLYSAYEYLEKRFGLGVRVAGSTTFVLWRLGWMGVALYVPCLAIKGATGNSIEATWMVVLLGVVVTCYTMLGGVKAVIWTDVTQFCVRFVGLFVTLAFIISQVPGGVSEVFRVADEAHRLSFTATLPTASDASWAQRAFDYFTTEITFAGIVTCILIGRIASYTSDQVAIQRLQTTRTFREARNAFVVNAFADTVWMFVLAFVGLALFAYFRNGLPDGMQNDKVLPYFMAQTFPAGLTGLVIASIISASLSSVDSALNSTTTIIVVDFYNRLWLGHVRPPEQLSESEQRQQLLVTRVVNVLLGIVMILIAANVERMGEIYTVANRILGAFFGTLLGTFLLGMFTRRANGVGVFCGALTGLAASCFLSFFGALTALHEPIRSLAGEQFVELFSHISWQWPPVFGITVTLLVGYSISRILGRSSDDTTKLTYWEVLRLPDPPETASL